MSPDDFSLQAPGRLVPTEGFEEFIGSDGRGQVRKALGKAFVPAPLPPKLDLGSLLVQVAEPLGRADRALGLLNGLAADKNYSSLLAAPLMQREAIVSSKIEDTIATPREIAAYTARKPGARRETIEVANYYDALIQGLRSPLPLCMRLACEMHRLLLHSVRGEQDRPGFIRSLQNRIGGVRSDFSSARFVPPPPGEELQRCLRNLEEFWNTDHGSLPPLVASAMAHYQFEAIHPFNDGNGRIGRALIVLELCRKNLLIEPLVYVSGFFERHRQDYYDHLFQVSAKGAWAEWCIFFLEAVVQQAADAANRLRALRDLRESTLRRIADSRSSVQLAKLVDRLIENPLLIDVPAAQRLLDVSDPTARKYLRQLEGFGFLREVTGSNYAQAWEPAALFDIIEQDEMTSTQQ